MQRVLLMLCLSTEPIAEDAPSTPEQQIDAGQTATALRWTPSRIGLESAINAEKAKDRGNSEPDLLQAETRLHKRLEKLRLDMHVVKGDGNCQVWLQQAPDTTCLLIVQKLHSSWS